MANFERLVRSGRVGRGRAWLGTRRNLKPEMALTMEGKIEPVVRGREAAKRRILELFDRALTPRPHAGIGAGGVFIQNEDGTNAATTRYD